MRKKTLFTVALVCSLLMLSTGCMKDKEELLKQKAAEEAALGLDVPYKQNARPEAAPAQEQTPAPRPAAVATPAPIQPAAMPTPEMTPAPQPVKTPEPTPTSSPTPAPSPTPKPTPLATPSPAPDVEFAGGVKKADDLDLKELDNALIDISGTRVDSMQPAFSKLTVAELQFTENLVFLLDGDTIVQTSVVNPTDQSARAALSVGIFKNGKQVETADLFEGTIEAQGSISAKAVFPDADYLSDEYEIRYLGKMRAVE